MKGKAAPVPTVQCVGSCAEELMGASAVRARAMDCAVVKAYYYGRERPDGRERLPSGLPADGFFSDVSLRRVRRGQPRPRRSRGLPKAQPTNEVGCTSTRHFALPLPFVIVATRLTRKNAASQNDGLHGEPPSDHRRPPGADRRHERAINRGKRSLLLPLSPARGAGAARRRGRLPPAPRRPRPLHTTAGAAIHTRSRAPRPPRPRARPQN